jgi:hypothetical protein
MKFQSIYMKFHGYYLSKGCNRSTIPTDCRGIATHELGHGISIGSIADWWPYPSLMYLYAPLEFLSVYNDPQQSDVALINQIYP